MMAVRRPDVEWEEYGRRARADRGVWRWANWGLAACASTLAPVALLPLAVGA
jgi:hypothetical protein